LRICDGVEICMSKEAYLHNLDPFLVRIYGEFGLRWYGLAYLAGFLAGYLIIRFMISRGLSPVPRQKVGDLVFALALGAILGGRLGYCLFYNPELFFRFTPTFPWWGVLAIHEGGMASHGGIIGVFIASIVYAYRNGIIASHVLDLTTLGGALGIFFGRIANFINGELPGRPAPESLPWAVKFPQDIFLWPAHDPNRLEQLDKTVSYLGISESQWQALIAAYRYESAAWAKLEGVLFRIIEAVQAGNPLVTESIRPLLIARHPSQIYAALLEGLVVFIILLIAWKKPRLPGIIGSLFLISYSLMRIVSEMFRLPDIGVGLQLFGLSRGQWLSLPLLLLGVLLFCYWSRDKNSKKYGGWKIQKISSSSNC